MNSGRDVSKPLPTNFPRAEGGGQLEQPFYGAVSQERAKTNMEICTCIYIYIHCSGLPPNPPICVPGLLGCFEKASPFRTVAFLDRTF